MASSSRGSSAYRAATCRASQAWSFSFVRGPWWTTRNFCESWTIAMKRRSARAGSLVPDLLQDVGDVQPDVALGVTPARVAPREALAHLRVGHERALAVVLRDEPRDELVDHGQLRWAVRTARTSAAKASTSSGRVSHEHIQRTSPVASSQT